MGKLSVTYYDIITHASNLGINFIPWERCKRGSRLGVGASMDVFDGTYEDHGTIQKVAFKSVKASLTGETRESRRSTILRDIKQEIRIMGRLKGHSRIVQLLAVSFKDHTPILILELAKSNLEEYLQNEQAEWKIKLGLMYDIALGIEAIHKVEAVHGDLKASNILIYDSDDYRVIAKISDFGYSSTDFSVQAGRTPGYSFNFRSLECFDPELHDWNGKHTTDIYSYGLVVYQISDNGKIPFVDYDQEEIDDMKKEGTDVSVIMELLPSDTPNEVRKIIKATIKNVPSERLSLDEIKTTLKKSTEWNQVYSYEEAKIAFESLTQGGTQKSIKVFKMNNLPIPPSLKTSIFREYQRLADNGDMVAMYNLAACWYYSFGTEHDFFKAFECSKVSAEAGNSSAQNLLGVLYKNGHGVSKDYIKALEWYIKASEVGNTDAQCNLGDCYRDGFVVTKDYIKAVELYTKAAEAGNIDAMNNLAKRYEKGQGVTKNYIKAVELYTKAAEAGSSSAQCNLGDCYRDGFGVTKDYIKAVEFYTKAAEAGHTGAMNNLARRYEEGQGVTKDYIKAVELYTKAVEAGNSGAQCNLGDCYRDGFGVTKDYIKAVELYTKAAEAGNTTAQYNLARCYEDGQGVTKDYIKALEWCTKAAKAGYSSASKAVERLRKLVENN